MTRYKLLQNLPGAKAGEIVYIDDKYSPIGYFSWNDAKKIEEKFPEELKLVYS